MTNGDNGSGGMGRSLTSATALLLASLLLVVLPSGSAVAQTPPDAVATAVQNAAANGVTSFVSVVDRNSGSVLAQTGNAGAPVASESIMKLFLAAYYLRLYGGQSATPQAVKDRLAYMLMYSDYADPWVMPTSPRIALPGKGSGLVRSA